MAATEAGAADSTGQAHARIARPLDRRTASAMASMLKVVADPTRLQLLSMIHGSPDAEVTVGAMARSLGLRQPTITHHLSLMHENGLLDRHQEGRRVWYTVTAERQLAVEDLLR